MGRTKVEWCARPGTIPTSWNPVTGCSKVSEGCKFCYAERMARRLAGRHGYPEYPHHFDVTLHPDRLEIPLRWEKPRTVFICSMSDLFHEDVETDWIAHIWGVMMKAEQHIFQVLTKRPARMLQFVRDEVMVPFPNIWLGITAENQRTADERIPLLLQTPAAVRFVSCEPLLGPIDLSNIVVHGDYEPAKTIYNLIKGSRHDIDVDGFGVGAPLPCRISWVIVGGESGPGARPMHPDWARSLRDQCQTAGIPCFFKQWGAWAPYIESSFVGEVTGHKVLPSGTFGEFGDGDASIGMSRVGKKHAGRLLDGKEWSEFPC